MEWFSSIGTPPALVELLSHLGISELIKQLVDEFNDLGSTASPMTEWNGDGLSRPSFEPDLGCNHLVFQQRHIFKQQTHHALAVSIRGAWIMPDAGEIFD